MNPHEGVIKPCQLVIGRTETILVSEKQPPKMAILPAAHWPCYSEAMTVLWAFQDINTERNMSF